MNAETPEAGRLAAFLRHLMESSNTGVAQVARVAGQAPSTVSRNLSGRVPSQEFVLALLAATNGTAQDRRQALHLHHAACHPAPQRLPAPRPAAEATHPSDQLDSVYRRLVQAQDQRDELRETLDNTRKLIFLLFGILQALQQRVGELTVERNILLEHREQFEQLLIAQRQLALAQEQENRAIGELGRAEARRVEAEGLLGRVLELVGSLTEEVAHLRAEASGRVDALSDRPANDRVLAGPGIADPVGADIDRALARVGEINEVDEGRVQRISEELGAGRPPAATAISAGEEERDEEDEEPADESEASRDGRIITFYSYKGGTGSSLTLANCAWILAANGNRVLMVDWDLEAPGLDDYFRPFLDQRAVDSSTGVTDLLFDYRESAAQRRNRGPGWLRNRARLSPHTLTIEWDGFPDGGRLDLLPAGPVESDHGAAVIGMDWEDLYSRLDGAAFFQALRQEMRRHYDYVLVDSRSGLADMQEICTVELPDDLVIGFTMSPQNIQGAAEIARKITQRHYGRGIRILPVPMRVEDGEVGLLTAARSAARRAFAGLPSGLDPQAQDRYWYSVEIPHVRYYTYTPVLATFGDRAGRPTNLLAACERLVDALTDGRVTGFPPMDEEARLFHLERFARQRLLLEPTETVVSFVAPDRLWAEWIEWVLTRAGLRVTSREVGSVQRADVTRAGSAVTRTVAVWSQAYAKAAFPRAEDHSELVTVRIDDTSPDPTAGTPVVDVTGMGEDAARGVLLSALELPPTEEGAPGPEGPRFPGRYPAIWNLRLRNPSFTGRAAVLDQLRDRLRGRQRDRRPTVVLPTAQTLYGLGGVGKTQVALEYTYRFVAEYDLVWWIDAEQPEQVALSLTELGRRLDLRVGENANENAEQVKETLRQGTHPKARRWLLVFDNADDPKEIVQFLPSGPGDVLVTSRNQAWSRHAEMLEVDVFRREESIEHLTRRGLTRQEADQVAEAVGDLPLAVEVAAAWLETTGTPVQEYVTRLNDTMVEMTTAPTAYPTTVGATWSVSVARLREQMPAAARLLQICAFLSPDSIATSILHSDQMMRALRPWDAELIDKSMMGRVIRAIDRYALAKVDNVSRTFQVHRLVQAAIRSEIAPEEEPELVHQVHRLLVGARPDLGDADDPENWPAFEKIWPHLAPSNAENCDESDTRQLLLDRVRYLRIRGDLDRAEELARLLNGSWTQKLGEDDRQTLQMRFELSGVLRRKGLARECLDLDQDTLDRQNRVLRSDHPHTLQTAGSLAADLRLLGRFSEALARDQEIYPKLREELGGEDLRTLAIANNLAIDQRLMGNYQAARALDEEVCAISAEVLGPRHPHTLLSKGALAEDLRALGDYQGSLDLLGRLRDEYSVAVPDLTSLHFAKSFALSLHLAGRQTEARQLTVDTYHSYLEHYSPEVPDARSCALNLAAVQSAAGDPASAAATARELYEDFTSREGEDHPFTLICANNLTVYLRAAGELQPATALGQRTLDLLRASLGANHPYSLTAMLNLANCHGEAGDPARCEELSRRAMTGFTTRYGDQHPHAVFSRANLAMALRQLGNRTEAIGLRDEAVAELVRQWGEEHPAVDSVRAWQRIGLDLEIPPV